MKKTFKLIGITAAACAVAWWLKDRLVPVPTTTAGPVAPFRSHDIDTDDGVETPDDLTAITGIGPVFAARLAAAGITKFADLAAAAAASVAAAVQTGEERAAGWIEQAKLRLANTGTQRGTHIQ